MYTERVYSIATITTGSTHMIAGVGGIKSSMGNRSDRMTGS